MNPIIFTSAEKQKCLSNHTKSYLLYLHLLIDIATIKTANWTGNLNYWTGGFQGCRGQWGWCTGADFIPIAENLNWATNQPEMLKENENCVHMRIHKNDSSTALSDRNCSDRYIFACEVAENVAKSQL
jgi:Lectin C-type domain